MCEGLGDWGSCCEMSMWGVGECLSKVVCELSMDFTCRVQYCYSKKWVYVELSLGAQTLYRLSN